MSSNSSDTTTGAHDNEKTEGETKNNTNEKADLTRESEQLTSTPQISTEDNVTKIVAGVISSSSIIVPTHTTAQRPNTSLQNANPLYSTVTIEDIGENDSPAISASVSRAEGVERRSPDTGANDGIPNNNNSMALLPVSQISAKTSQMIPIALLRKASNCTSAEECCGGSGAGIMHLITGSNKVAPAETACATDSTACTMPTTVGAVLMLIPKKSECVCVDIPDAENNPTTENQSLEQQADSNCQQNEDSNQQEVAVRPTQSYDSYEDVCRICHDNPSKMELISPCLCKGSMSKVHRACLERWLAESAKNSCEICNYEYNTVRKPKYKGCRSVYEWIRNPLSPSDMRNLFFDIACFFILTPLAAISSWLCVVGAQHYTFGEERRRRAKFRNEASALWDVHGHDARGDASNATWTSVGLLSLTGTLLVAYSVWLFVAIKYHIQAWREWQQRNYTVTIVPFEDGCMGRPPPARPPRNQSANNNNGSLLNASDNGHSTYNFDANPNLLRYSGHNSVMRGRGRNLLRQNRQSRRNYNLPPIFNRNHFLRNPPPGYTISETTLLYQALYGSDSDAFINENFLAFFADSSDNITPESSSQLVAEYQLPNSFAVAAAQPLADEQRQQSSNTNPASDLTEAHIKNEERTGFSTVVDTEFPACSSTVNNNKALTQTSDTVAVSHKVALDGSKSQTNQEKRESFTVDEDKSNENQSNEKGNTEQKT